MLLNVTVLPTEQVYPLADELQRLPEPPDGPLKLNEKKHDTDPAK
jgi:hypothetical protein